MATLREERHGPVVLLTLDRPERLNAINGELLGELGAACAAIRDAGEVRAVVLIGAGERAFSAGADVAELDDIGAAGGWLRMREGQRVFDSIAALPQPVIAAVNGVAFGGGCELALACDFRLLAAGARVGQPEITLANVPGWGGTQRLPRIVGQGRATEMILTGAPIDAETALAWGFANGVHADGELLDAALDLARSLAEKAPLALALAKQTIALGLERGIEAGLLAEAEAVARCCDTEEQRQATKDFLESAPRPRAPRS